MSFILDSGASDHMVWSQKWLVHCHEIQRRGIMLGDGNKVLATHHGNVELKASIRYESDQYDRPFVLQGVSFT